MSVELDDPCQACQDNNHAKCESETCECNCRALSASLPHAVAAELQAKMGTTLGITPEATPADIHIELLKGWKRAELLLDVMIESLRMFLQQEGDKYGYGPAFPDKLIELIADMDNKHLRALLQVCIARLSRMERWKAPE